MHSKVKANCRCGSKLPAVQKIHQVTSSHRVTCRNCGSRAVVKLSPYASNDQMILTQVDIYYPPA